MIKTNNLTIKAGDKILLEEVNIAIPGQKLTVIMGANGTGKTTLLKTLAGIIKPTGDSVASSVNETFYLPQRIDYPDGITLYEYISSVYFKSKWKWHLDREEKCRIYDILEDLNLLDKKNLFLNQLSAGELQKANIGLGIISGAELLLLDEPTSNMDLYNQIKVLDSIKNLNKKNITSVIILHDINIAARYGDFFIGITNKREVITGDKDSVLNRETLKDIYGIDFTVINHDEHTFVQIRN